jgi:hypothetical protein
MASLGDVGTTLRRALDKLDQSTAAHRKAADFARAARDLLAVVGAGTSQDDVERACTEFTAVVDGIVEPEGQLDGLAAAAETIRGYAVQLGIDLVPQTSKPSAASSIENATAPVEAMRVPASAERVEALRAQLPPPVERGTG